MKSFTNLLIAIHFIPFSSIAQDITRNPEIVESAIISVTSDQDLFALPLDLNDDRNYTMGVSLEVSHPNLEKKFTHKPFYWIVEILKEKGDTIKPVYKLLPFNTSHYSSTLGLVGTAFTPDSLSSTNIVNGDRPYTFFLGLSTRSNYLSITPVSRYKIYSLGINYGLFGTYIGREVQSWIHEHISGSPIPRGWKNQIGEGGVFSFLVDFSRFQSFRKKLPRPGQNLNSQLALDGGWQVGGSAGYYNRVYFQTGIRLGCIDLEDVYDWFGSFNSLSTATFQVDGENESDTKRWEFFIFSKLMTQFMVRNSMLEGVMFSSDLYSMPPDWTNPFIVDFVQGIAVSKKWYCNSTNKIKTFSLQYQNTQRSPEFNSGIFPERWHYFGSIAIIFSI